MTLPALTLRFDTEGAPVVVIAPDTVIADIPSLIATVPALMAAEHASDAAAAINHLSDGRDYAVITDPQAFASAYLTQYDSEADQDWDQMNPRLGDYARPDFRDLAAPVYGDGSLVYYVKDSFLGLAFCVVVSHEDPTPKYMPVPSL